MCKWRAHWISNFHLPYSLMWFTLLNRLNMCLFLWRNWGTRLPVSINSLLVDPESLVFVLAHANMLNYPWMDCPFPNILALWARQQNQFAKLIKDIIFLSESSVLAFQLAKSYSTFTLLSTFVLVCLSIFPGREVKWTVRCLVFKHTKLQLISVDWLTLFSGVQLRFLPALTIATFDFYPNKSEIPQCWSFFLSSLNECAVFCTVCLPIVLQLVIELQIGFKWVAWKLLWLQFSMIWFVVQQMVKLMANQPDCLRCVI